MKTIATAFAAIALTLGAATQASARDYCESDYRTTVYISGYASCGTPIYTERYVVRVDRYGHPIWGCRRLPVSYHRGHRGHDRGSHGRGGYDRYRRSDYGYQREYRRGPSPRDVHEAHRDNVRRLIGGILR
jgi:hypothetical protein